MPGGHSRGRVQVTVNLNGQHIDVFRFPRSEEVAPRQYYKQSEGALGEEVAMVAAAPESGNACDRHFDMTLLLGSKG